VLSGGAVGVVDADGVHGGGDAAVANAALLQFEQGRNAVQMGGQAAKSKPGVAVDGAAISVLTVRAWIDHTDRDRRGPDRSVVGAAVSAAVSTSRSCRLLR
jgi:hypothetical protein